MDDEFFRANYNTPFDDLQQYVKYQQWTPTYQDATGRTLPRDKMNELYDYDLQGAYKKYGNKVFSADNGHGTDEFKKPNHPTFSNESIYHGTPAPWGGVHEGGEWVRTTEGDTTGFRPSQQMLDRTHDMINLQRYFKEREPNLQLHRPAASAND